jgi:hypothetical protein
MNCQPVNLTLRFDPECFDELELHQEAQMLIHQLNYLDEVERVDRLIDSNPPQGIKSALGAAIVGALTAEVNAENCLKVLQFLRDRLVGKSIYIKIEANGKQVEMKACSLRELNEMLKLVQRFINGL